LILLKANYVKCHSGGRGKSAFNSEYIPRKAKAVPGNDNSNIILNQINTKSYNHNRTRIARIKRVSTDLIRGDPQNQRHPRSIFLYSFTKSLPKKYLNQKLTYSLCACFHLGKRTPCRSLGYIINSKSLSKVVNLSTS